MQFIEISRVREKEKMGIDCMDCVGVEWPKGGLLQLNDKESSRVCLFVCLFSNVMTKKPSATVFL